MGKRVFYLISEYFGHLFSPGNSMKKKFPQGSNQLV